MTAKSQLPRYRSHKEVWALKLSRVRKVMQMGESCYLLTPHDATYSVLFVTRGKDKDLYDRLPTLDVGREAKDPGYYVQYEDGFKSWSPTEAFENGYTLIE